jgi:hypothetical protein
MLTEGKERLSTYRVVWFHEGNHCDEYVVTENAQGAVDYVRKRSAPSGAEIIEVAKVVNNWK